MVKHLQAGRTSAVNPADVELVTEAVVQKTLPHLSPMVQDMVKVQRYICGRPQDVFNMRLCDIDMSSKIWKYTPFKHKTKKLGKIRELPVGPRAQRILKPYIKRCKDNPEQFIFITPRGKQYTGQYYNQAIAAACKKAGIAKWAPNQLRHAGGTAVRDKFGLDCAQVMLGHSKVRTTELYAKVAYEKAERVAEKLG